MSDSATQTCTTCETAGGPDDFYQGTTECKPCKRDRSRQNRELNARKIGLADRFLDLVWQLANEGLLRDQLFALNKQEGPASDSTAARPQVIGSQEIQS